MSSKPLAGRRVVITRASEQGLETERQLQALGATPLVFPTIQFVPLSSPELQKALRDLPHYDWVLFSSANAVRFFFHHLQQQDLPATLPHVAATGSVTAQHLAEQGVHVDFVPQEFRGEALAAGLGQVQDQRILLPRSRLGRPELAESLRQQGAHVDDIPIYDILPAQPSAEALSALSQGFDAILFASPSSVRNFLQITEPTPIIHTHLRQAVIACIGPVTARACQKYDLAVHVMPSRYTLPDLLQALTEYLTSIPIPKRSTPEN
ncbi:MAG: uroporphyrinogen-III synthase [Chloroflexi bacterium]|nr:uroporphyrinogen-III synthase [Chloroflexota bacterium]